jgi:hypothetical protein
MIHLYHRDDYDCIMVEHEDETDRVMIHFHRDALGASFPRQVLVETLGDTTLSWDMTIDRMDCDLKGGGGR